MPEPLIATNNMHQVIAELNPVEATLTSTMAVID